MTEDSEILLRFGKRIKSLRVSRGLSQEKLAELAGFDRTYISMVERGKRNIALKNIYKLANTFDLDLAKFFYDI